MALIVHCLRVITRTGGWEEITHVVVFRRVHELGPLSSCTERIQLGSYHRDHLVTMSSKKGPGRKINALETKIHKAALSAGRVRELLL